MFLPNLPKSLKSPYFPQIALAFGGSEVLTSSICERVRRFCGFGLGGAVGQGVVAVLNIVFVFMCLSCLWMFWLIKVETCIFWIGLTHCGHGAYLSMLFGVYAGIIYLMIFQHQIFSKKNTQQKDRAKKVFFQLRLRFFSTFGSCVHSFELIFTLRNFFIWHPGMLLMFFFPRS